jgi:1,4-dihydroxy-2-naphthoate octaprenyltransferase
MNIEAWIKAFRLRTLPLSLSSVILGSLLAMWQGSFHLEILVGALVTTLFLQILSNLANDYGDFQNGIDNEKRVGPQRALQSGEINPSSMKWAIAIFAVLSLASGIWLLYEASKVVDAIKLLTFLLIGLLAIAAAVKYTIGKKPYGYRGMGDLAVFIFFGLTGVGGTFYLHTNEISWVEILPAVSIGLLATGVLNLNNLRDEENDRISGKHSLVVLLGRKKAKIYHLSLISVAILSALVFTILNYESPYQWLFLMAIPMLFQNMLVVMRNEQPSELDAELKKLAIATLIFALTLGIGLNY